ncbi:MAG: restriction endonuclease subunit S [Anaerobutyricum sp.]
MAKLGEICAFQSGGTPSKNKPEYFGGEIPWISTTALNGGKINEADAVAWITPKAIRESAAKIVPANSIMVGTRVGIGKVAINTVEMSTSQDVISLIGIDKDKWYKPYLCKLLLSKKDYFNSQARGATIKGIKIDVVANIDVLEIDYATQRKVAATLNKIDTLIVLRKQQLEKLDELIKARFVEMFGEPVSNPYKFEVRSLQNMLDDGIITYHLDGNHGSDYPRNEEFVESGVSYISANCIIDDTVNLNLAKHLTEERAAKLRKGIAQDEDVLFAHNATVGPVAILHTRETKVILGTSLTAYRCNKQRILPAYLKAYMQSEGFVRQYTKDMKQTTRNQVPITAQRKYLFIVPPLSLQNQFAAFVERVDQQKQTVQQSLEKLELMKKALMQEYFG